MNTAKKYIKTSIVGLIMFFIVAFSRNLFNPKSTEYFYRFLCDSFFVPGAILTAFGLLVIASNGGTFDIIVYGVKSAFSLFLPVGKRNTQTFSDYRTMKHREETRYGYLLIIGLKR